MKTKAIILAAGKGSRLLPLTQDIPKSLVLINQKPIITYILDSLSEAGIKEAIIVIGHCGDKVKSILGDNYHGIDLKYVDNPIYQKTEGAYSSWLAKELAGEDFLIIHGDTLFNKSILKNLMDSNHEIALSVDDSIKNGMFRDDAMKVISNQGRVTDIGKNLPNENSNGDAIGIYRFRGNGARLLFNQIKELIDSDVMNKHIPLVVNFLSKKYPVYQVSTNGLPWIEIDDHNDLKNATEIIEKIMRN